jgi:hypothetical protein
VDLEGQVEKGRFSFYQWFLGHQTEQKQVNFEAVIQVLFDELAVGMSQKEGDKFAAWLAIKLDRLVRPIRMPNFLTVLSNQKVRIELIIG